MESSDATNDKWRGDKSRGDKRRERKRGRMERERERETGKLLSPPVESKCRACASSALEW